MKSWLSVVHQSGWPFIIQAIGFWLFSGDMGCSKRNSGHDPPFVEAVCPPFQMSGYLAHDWWDPGSSDVLGAQPLLSKIGNRTEGGGPPGTRPQSDSVRPEAQLLRYCFKMIVEYCRADQ